MADLGNIDAEIKRINELKDKYQSLLSVEQEVNKSLIYSSGVRKKYTDALKAASEIQKDIVKKERDYENSITKNSQAVTLNMKKHKSLKLEQAKLIKDQKALKTSGKKNSAMWKENNKKIKDLQKSISATESAIKSYENAMDESIKDAEAMKNSTKGLKKVFDQIAKIDDSQVGSQDELNSATRKRISLMKQQLNIQEKAGVLSAEDSKELKGKLNKLDEMHTIQGDLIKGSVSDDLAPMIDDLTKEAKNIADPKKFKADPKRELARSRTAAESKMGLSLRGAQATSLKTIFSGKTSFGDKLKAAGSFKDASKDISKLNDVMKVTGKGASIAGGSMKMLGSALGSLGKLGWIGLVVQAVTAIASAVNRLDKFLKGFNQSFAKLQGPTVTMKNIDKEMTKFSQSIFDLQRNLKYGLKSEEIVGMFQAVSESGMSLQGILNNVQGGYGKMIDEAAKVSLNFGVSVQEAGAMLGEQMTDLRSTVDEAAEGFKVLSYDASIAGIQSQKFYQATYAAAEALSYYGKFLESASTTLKNFQKQGGMGFKDAQKQTQTMTNLFKDMDNNQRVMFMQLSGGVESYREDFVRLEKESGDKIAKVLESLKGKENELAEARKKGDQKEIDRITNLISAEKEQLKTLESTYATAKAAAEGTAQDMAVHLEALSDTIGKRMGVYLSQLRKNFGPDVFKDFRATLEHMKGTMPVSDEFARNMEKALLTSKEGIKRMAGELDKVLPEGKRSQFGDKISKIIEDSTKDGVLNTEKVKQGLSEIEELNSKDLDTIMSSISEFPRAVVAFMKNGYKDTIDNVEEITLKEMEGVKQEVGETREDENKRLNDLVNNTRTIEDFIGITKENAEYLLAGNNLQKGMALAAVQTAKSVGGIFSFLQGRFGRGKEKILNDPEKNDMYRGIKQMGASIKILEGQKALTKDESKQKEIQKEIDRMKEESQRREEGLLKTFGEELGSQLISMANESAAVEASRKLQEKKKTESTMTLNEESMKPKKDYKAQSGGYALLSKGDVVVNARSMSTGVGGDIGAFAGTAASSLMKNISSGQSPVGAPQIPVNINIGSISGDPEEFLQRIKPAIEQAFERMYYDKQKRV